MNILSRFGVSVDSELLASFDELCQRNGYGNRSEALRDLIRKALVQDAWERSCEGVAGTLTLVYDHHAGNIARKLMHIQHDDHDCILATLHVHLDHHNCLEVLILKGEPQRIHNLAKRLLSVKGVKHGAFSHTTTGEALI